MPEIEDIIETSQQAPILLWWQWTLIVLAVIIIASIAKRLFKKRKRAASSPDKSLPQALQELRKLEKISDAELSISVSRIVRSFLQQKFQHQTLFQTQEEFVSDHEDMNHLPQQAKDHLIHYLNTLAAHKYSPSTHLPSDQNELTQHTSSLLKSLNTIQPAEPPTEQA